MEHYKMFYQKKEMVDIIYFEKQPEWPELDLQQQADIGRPFAEEEIWEALQLMKESSAAGIDGIGVR